MSHRQSAILLLVALLVMIQFHVTGRAARAWSALTGGTGGAAGSGGSAGGTVGGTTGTIGGLGGGVSGAFGLSNITYTHPAPSQYWQGPDAPDRGLVPNEVGEINYQLPAGSTQSIFLPHGGAGWSEVVQGQQPGLGGYEVWKDPLGATLGFLHLSTLWDQTAGTAGTIGTTGWPTDPTGRFGQPGPSNAHLAVIYDQAGAKYV